MGGAETAPAQASAESQLKELGQRLTGISHDVTGITHDVVSFFGFGPAQANNPTDPQPLMLPARPELKARAIEPEGVVAAAALPAVPVAARERPSVEHPLRRLFCVLPLRLRSTISADDSRWLPAS